MIRTALLNWNNINRDSDFSKYIESISWPWVIEWLEVSASSVAEWYAWISCERSNWETVYPVVYITTPVEISGDWEVYIEVKQSAIDNGELSNEDWTGIAEVKVWTTPSKNAIKLATITWWVVEDNRVFIPKLDNLRQTMETLFASVEDLDDRVEALEEAWAIDHLEESAVAWELYALTDALFRQDEPTLSDSVVDCNISDVDANTQIHIQRIASGTAANQLKLKLRMVWASTQDLTVEVRKWVQVTVTPNSEAYWYWDEVVASGTIPYTSITSSYSEITVTLNAEFWGTAWELLDVVLSMPTVNASNYYCVACSSLQYSEWFGYVSVNGTTRTRQKLMPYVYSSWFRHSMLCKSSDAVISSTSTRSFTPNTPVGIYDSTDSYYRRQFHSGAANIPYAEDRKVTLFTAVEPWSYTFKIKAWIAGSGNFKFWFGTSYDNILDEVSVTNNYTTETEYTATVNLGVWQTLYAYPELLGGGSSSKVYEYLFLSSYSYTASYSLNKNSDTVWFAKQIYSIWDLGAITIFGMFNWTFYPWKTTTSATTGSITLGNAVWYINIWGYKIPYYL